MAWASRKTARARVRRVGLGAAVAAAVAVVLMVWTFRRDDQPAPRNEAIGVTAVSAAADVELTADIAALADIDRALAIGADWGAIEAPLKIYGLLGEPERNP